MTERAAVILAAGQGTRMKSPLPKVLHPVGGRTMLDRAIDAAERRGVQIFEGTEVTDLGPRRAVTTHGVVEAEHVVVATEAWTPKLPGGVLTGLPLTSMMIATEPLPADVWDRIGWPHGLTIRDKAHLFFYAQRTPDNRIAIGGRGSPYRLSRPYAEFGDRDGPVWGRLERTIAEHWMAVLNVDKAGVHDDFFAAGGHSLQAARLMFRLNSALPGNQVGLLDFHRTPTIAALAALVDEGTRREHTLLQELLPATEHTALTLVCCPYAGAAATMYRPLADALARRGAPVALYAVAVPGNEVGSENPALDSVDALAAACVREIVASVPGRVALYGHCVGSNLALEITRRLELAGRTVDFLAVGGALPATMEDKVLMEEDIWAGVRDADIHALIRSWGGSAEPVEADALAFIIANFKKDSRMASRYEYARGDWTVRAPIHAIFGSADPLTPEFETRYLRWLEVSDTVHLAVVDGGHHYFVGDQPDAVAQVLHQAAPVTSTEGVQA